MARPVREHARRCPHDPTLRHLVTLRTVRPADHRGADAARVPRAGAQVRRGPAGRRRRRADAPTCWTAGSRCSTALETDPIDCAARAGLARQARGCSRATATATASTGTTRGCTLDRPAVLATCGPSRGLYHRLRRRAGAVERLVTDGAGRRGGHAPAGGHPGVLPRRVPARATPESRGGVAGTPSSSTSRAATRCSGCRRGTRCGGPGRTWVRCSTAARRPAPARRARRRA